MNPRRIVVTGLGVLTPIGNTVSDYWIGLSSGLSGCAPITKFDSEKFKTRFACELKGFDVLDYIDRREAKRMDPYAQYAIITADEAIKDSGLDLEKEDRSRIGVILGSGVGGIQTFQQNVSEFALGDGTPRFNPFFIPKMIADIAPGLVSIRHNLSGPNFTTVSACASSANAMIDAFLYISMGISDVMLTGGSEAAISEVGIGGFNALYALSTRNESPKTACRPFDKTRDGFVLGEGSGTIILEEYEHAKSRGAKIYCELVGVGVSADAYHMTTPHPEGKGIIAVIKNALRSAKINPEDIDAINTHGTSTPLGDVAELKAISEVFGDYVENININSTKSMTGHLLGGSGAIEVISCVLSMQHGIIPPTINHSVIDEDINPALNLTLNKAQKRDVKTFMSNTFGFGGHNACLIFRKL